MKQASEHLRAIEEERTFTKLQDDWVSRVGTHYTTAEVEAQSFGTLWKGLSAEQREEYEEGRVFTVVGQSGRRYSIVAKGSCVGNVFVDSPRGRTGMCCHTRDLMSPALVYLTQKLAIELNEQHWLKTAIQSGRVLGAMPGETPVWLVKHGGRYYLD